MIKPLYLLALSSFFITLFFSFATHPFEIPDEQSHYATVHYLVSEGKMPILADDSDLSLEEEKTEFIFGIMSEGNNRYSYHPEFRIEQSNNLIGPHEEQIKGFNTPELRRTYTIHQAAIYPPLYYSFTALFYNLVKSSDILMRLFISRLPSVMFTTIAIIFTYYFGRLAFDSNKYGLTLSLLTILFPMTSYLGSGVNSDNLHNLLFTAFLFLCLKLIHSGWETRITAFTGLVVGLDILTKPQAFIMFPIFLVAVALSGAWRHWRLTLRQLLYFGLVILLVSSWLRQPQYLDPGTILYGGWDNFLNLVRHYYSLVGPMLVWYWGVFKWFGVVLPKPLWYLANRLVILAIIGIIISFTRDWHAKKLSFANRVAIFSLLSNLGYLFSILWFDWQFYQEVGRSLGLQARYFLPLLTTQLFLLLHGLTCLSNIGWIKEKIRVGIVIFFLFLHLSGLFTQLSAYYDFSSWTTFLSQISQYKPFFAKGNWWYLWLTLYLTGIIATCRLVFSSLFLPTMKQK